MDPNTTITKAEAEADYSRIFQGRPARRGHGLDRDAAASGAAGGRP